MDPTHFSMEEPVIRYLAVLAVGYVLGSKAGRRRYEQIAGTYRAVTGSPPAKAVIEAGRRKIANRVSPDTGMVTLTSIDADTAVLEPEAAPKGDQRKTR
jgi:hypothetical protein